MQKCEWKEHKGENPPKLTEKEKELGWWMKDPEWVWMCPRCQNKYWDDFLKEYRKSKSEDLRTKK